MRSSTKLDPAELSADEHACRVTYTSAALCVYPRVRVDGLSLFEMKSVLVVGCGITGSTIAHLLSRRLAGGLPGAAVAATDKLQNGVRVEIWDKGSRPGGRFTTYVDKETGATCDMVSWCSAGTNKAVTKSLPYSPPSPPLFIIELSLVWHMFMICFAGLSSGGAQCQREAWVSR